MCSHILARLPVEKNEEFCRINIDTCAFGDSESTEPPQTAVVQVELNK